MAVESTNTSDVSNQMAHRIAAKKTELMDTEDQLDIQKRKAESAGHRAVQETVDKNEQVLVSISKEGASQADKLRQQQKTQSEQISKNSQDHYLKMSEDAVNQFKTMDKQVAQQISDYQRGKLEKLAYVEDRGKDTFYHLKSFEATVAEGEKDFNLVVKLPAHEAQNLLVTTDGANLKLSLARSYEAAETLEDGTKNRTSNYQTILETIALPAKPDMHNVQRTYADGKLTIRIGKFS